MNFIYLFLKQENSFLCAYAIAFKIEKERQMGLYWKQYKKEAMNQDLLTNNKYNFLPWMKYHYSGIMIF